MKLGFIHCPAER